MAGDWIKMRGGLFSSPKLIAMSRHLHDQREFRDWLTPGGGGPMNGQIVSDHALRCVTGALLCVTWSWSREFGKELPNGDCLLERIGLPDIDGIGGAPGLGDAMGYVEWAIESDDPDGVILPKFFCNHNVPLSSAEKQRAYRERKKQIPDVTEALPTKSNKTVTREEKRRVSTNVDTTPTPLFKIDAIPEPLRIPEFLSAWDDWVRHRAEIRKKLTPTAARNSLIKLEHMGPPRATQALRHSIANGWQGIFEPDESRGKGKASPGDCEEIVYTDG